MIDFKGVKMPVYEFACAACKKIFEVTMSMVEAGVKKVVCPECDSDDVNQLPSSFSAVTSRKS